MKVTYKDRLSRVETNTNAAWGPIERITVPGPTPGSSAVEKTVTCDEGIRFIPHPPDLRSEPPREEWVDDNVKKVAENCFKIPHVRYEKDLTELEKRDWHVLGSMLSSVKHSGAIPNMPLEAQATGSDSTASYLPSGESASYKLDGTPRPLLPILRGLMRFDRPLITWDIFNEPPPKSFSTRSKEQHTNSTSHQEDSEGVRDPRIVNNVVHMNFSQGEWKRGQASLSVQEWLETTPTRLEREELHDGCLYIVKLDEADGEFCLGLVQLDLVSSKNDIIGWWFGRKSKSNTWPAQHVPFERYPPHGQWVSDTLDEEAILLAVEDSDLTPSGLKEKSVRPALNSAFMVRLRAFATKYNLVVKKDTVKDTKGGPAPQATAPVPPNQKGLKRKGRSS